MEKLILTEIVELIAIAPLLVMSLNKPAYSRKLLLLFIAYFFIYECLLTAPMYISTFRFIEGNWNWSGKTYAILGSLLFYLKFRKEFTNHNYITFRQNNNSLKPKFYVTIAVFIVTVALAVFFTAKPEGRTEYLWFQFTMPGLDEELAFRGIMLGLLSNLLNPKVYLSSINLGNPALLITSILFGLCHSFSIDSNWNFHQNWFVFLNTFGIGLLLGWLTIKSGSILMSIFTHNLINTLPKIIFWL